MRSLPRWPPWAHRLQRHWLDGLDARGQRTPGPFETNAITPPYNASHNRGGDEERDKTGDPADQPGSVDSEGVNHGSIPAKTGACPQYRRRRRNRGTCWPYYIEPRRSHVPPDSLSALGISSPRGLELGNNAHHLTTHLGGWE